MAGNVMSIQSSGNMDAEARRHYADVKKINQGDIGSAPSWLNKNAKKIWKLVVEHYKDLPVLTELDRTGLTTLCVAASKLEEMDRRLVEAQDADEEKELIKIRQSYEKTFKSLSSDFGLTPKDRSALAAALREASIELEHENDPLLEALNIEGM